LVGGEYPVSGAPESNRRPTVNTSACAAQASLKRTVGQIRGIPLSGVHNGQRAFAGRVQQPQRTRHDLARESNVVNDVGVATRFPEIALKVDQDDCGVWAVRTGSASSVASRSTNIVTFFE
jgi:hypothetical protein